MFLIMLFEENEIFVNIRKGGKKVEILFGVNPLKYLFFFCNRRFKCDFKMS